MNIPLDHTPIEVEVIQPPVPAAPMRVKDGLDRWRTNLYPGSSSEVIYRAGLAILNVHIAERSGDFTAKSMALGQLGNALADAQKLGLI